MKETIENIEKALKNPLYSFFFGLIIGVLLIVFAEGLDTTIWRFVLFFEVFQTLMLAYLFFRKEKKGK